MALIPEGMAPEQAFQEIMRRLHSRWRLIIMLPLIYIFGGILVQRFHFQPDRGGEGFLPLDEEVYLVALFVGGAFAVGLWRLLALTERRQLLELTTLRSDPNAFLRRAREQQMMRFALCDIAAAPGILLFLLEGDLFPLMAFVVISLVLYLRVIPSGRKLGEAMFRPDMLSEDTKRG
jgi:hypothetical protein